MKFGEINYIYAIRHNPIAKDLQENKNQRVPCNRKFKRIRSHYWQCEIAGGVNHMGRLFTAKELAEALNLNVQTIYRASKRGDIPTYRIGKTVRFEMPTKDKVETLKQE